MRLVQSVRLGAWLLIGLNLMMAFGSIWIFTRMAPAIEIIIEQNERSLFACEEMLANLALVNTNTSPVEQLEGEFQKSLERAKNNITEKDETAVIGTITKNYQKAFQGDLEGQRKTIAAIRKLSLINRNAMVFADGKARQLGHAGAWGIVFMASGVFLVGMLFRRGLKRNLVMPLEEIHTVIKAFRSGDQMRRCIGAEAPQDIRVIYGGLNEIMDQKTTNVLLDTNWES